MTAKQNTRTRKQPAKQLNDAQRALLKAAGADGKKRQPSNDDARYTVGQLAVEKYPNDPTAGAKRIRARLRSNFEHVRSLDPAVGKAKDHANDGNRWPAMNAAVRQFVMTGRKDDTDDDQ